MLKDLSQEITNQSDNLIQLAPKILELNQMLEQPMISNDLIEEYNNVPVSQKDAWVKMNAERINTYVDPKLDSLIIELATSMDAIFGSNQRVQSLMAAQQQQNLQSAQKTNIAQPDTKPTKSTEVVDSLE